MEKTYRIHLTPETRKKISESKTVYHDKIRQILQLLDEINTIRKSDKDK